MRRWPRRAASLRVSPRWRVFALSALGAVACSAAAASRHPTASRREAPVAARAPASARAALRGPRTVRILLATARGPVRVSSDGEWQIVAPDGQVVALTGSRESWVLARDGERVSARREDSSPVSRRESTLIVRAMEPDGTLLFNGRRWRGELLVSAAARGLQVVNRVPLDEYVRGVVPLEIGTSASADAAAVEAQAVAARSYAVTHEAGPGRAYDMLATVADQVYGGATAETAVGNRAVDATAGLVLRYGNRVVNAPYHASCGGSTAEPQDVWRTGPEPYLRRVSDGVPGTSRFYCDGAPRYRWTRSMTGDALRQAIARYVGTLSGAAAATGRIRLVSVSDVTPAGRVAALTIETDGRRLVLRGNEIRDALRSPSGELLYSTYFSVDAVAGAEGVQTLTLHGGGNGHGVGMCQSGAIGRARAGQDFRTILQTYYPGTVIGAIE